MKTILEKNESDAIVKKVAGLRAEHEKLRVDNAMNKLSKVSELRRVRGEIARNLTYLHQKGALEDSRKQKKKK